MSMPQTKKLHPLAVNLEDIVQVFRGEMSVQEWQVACKNASLHNRLMAMRMDVGYGATERKINDLLALIIDSIEL